MSKPKVLRTFDFEGKKKVNINVIRPVGYLFSEAFRETVEAIARDAWAADVDYTISENYIDESRNNIILGAHLACLQENKLIETLRNTTIINLERLNYFGETWGAQAFKNYCEILKENKIVDYCQTNNRVLQETLNKEAEFLYRPWHDQRWQKIPNTVTKEHDICIIGSETDRRKEIISKLKERGLKVEARTDLFSTERDQILAKSKIILNIHAYENSQDIELWRMNYLASNGLYILSENSRFEEGEIEIERQINQAPFEQLAEKAVELVKQYEQGQANQRGNQLRETVRGIQSKSSSTKEKKQEHNKYLEKLHLNLGCGQTYYEDALNIDERSGSRGDLSLDISQPWEKVYGIHTLRDGKKALLHSSQFDVIEANETLHTTKDLQQTLANICKLLKPGGVLYFQSPFQNSSDAWANPNTRREINENIIPYLNEWSKYTELGDAKLLPRYIHIKVSGNISSGISSDGNARKEIDACFVKRIDSRGPVCNSFLDFHRSNLGTLRLSERAHRKLFIHSSPKQIEKVPSGFNPTVSILTPTMSSRLATLPLLWEWILRQNYPHDKIQWIIGTDTEEEMEYLKKKLDQGTSRGIDVKIKSAKEKFPIGKKRNFCNYLADGEILINMDDDDYYFPERISHSVEKLKDSELCASQQLPIYFLDDKTMWISDPGKGFACAGSFSYRKSILSKTWYSDCAINGEEISFTDFYNLKYTNLDAFKTMICIAHTNNTFSKHRLRDNVAQDRWEIQSKQVMTGSQYLYKIEKSIDEPKNDDWRDWYEYCFNPNIKLKSPNKSMPELFSDQGNGALEKFAEAALRIINRK